MKKSFLVIALVALVSMLVSTGCSAPVEAPTTAPAPAPAPATTPQANAWPEVMTIATASSGSSSYVMAAALAKLIEEQLDIPVTVTSAGAAERARLVVQGEAELCMPNELLFYEATRGIGTFAKEGKLPLQYVCYTTPLYSMLMVRGKVDTFADLKGKRCMFDNPTAPQKLAEADALLEFHKMNRDDINLMKYSRAEEAYDAIRAGTADATIEISTPGGSAAIQELANAVDLTFLSLSDAELEHCTKAAPYLSGATLAAGTFKGQDQPVQVLAQGQCLVAHSDLPEDLVYAISKILMDSCGPDTPGDFTRYHTTFDWTLQDNVDTLLRKAGPFHPGVIKYLKERGVWTPDMDKIQAELEAL